MHAHDESLAMNRALAVAAAAATIVIAGLAVAVFMPRIPQPERVVVGGPFQLLDGGGHTVTDRDFRGRWMLIYFGYTHCPDACPTTLSDLASAIDKLPAADRAQVAPLFITVDPARDTPAVMGNYAHAFGAEFTGLTGSDEQIAAAERGFRVFAQKHPLKGNDYAMDHSSVIYVMGPTGNLAGLLDTGMKPAEMAQRLRELGV